MVVLLLAVLSGGKRGLGSFRCDPLVVNRSDEHGATMPCTASKFFGPKMNRHESS